MSLRIRVRGGSSKYASIKIRALVAARSTSLESELDHLRVVVRLTVEFHDYLRQVGTGALDHNQLTYACESVFSGVDSFCNVNAAYRVLVGATSSRIEWATISTLSPREEFLSTFRRFDLEERFEEKCRLLLDLFKLQIVFAGMMYD